MYFDYMLIQLLSDDYHLVTRNVEKAIKILSTNDCNVEYSQIVRKLKKFNPETNREDPIFKRIGLQFLVRDFNSPRDYLDEELNTISFNVGVQLKILFPKHELKIRFFRSY